jgi:hypothetical protein
MNARTPRCLVRGPRDNPHTTEPVPHWYVATAPTLSRIITTDLPHASVIEGVLQQPAIDAHTAPYV